MDSNRKVVALNNHTPRLLTSIGSDLNKNKPLRIGRGNVGQSLFQNTEKLLASIFSTNKSTSTGNELNHALPVRRESCFMKVNPDYSIPVFWINLKRSIDRRKYFHSQMNAMGMKNKRIEAVTPQHDIMKNITLKVIPSVENLPNEQSTVVSHLLAIYNAVHDQDIDPLNEFALIMEDDVNIEFDIDFRLLALTAPKEFGIIQLITSDSTVANRLWNEYKKAIINNNNQTDDMKTISSTLFTKRKTSDPFWSVQGYIINKKVIQKFIDRVVIIDKNTLATRIKIVDTNEYPCIRGQCSFPHRIVSDTYIYSGGNPSYIIKIPLFNGAHVGENSTIHLRKNNDISHAKAFKDIHVILDDIVINNKELLPKFIRPKKCKVKQY